MALSEQQAAALQEYNFILLCDKSSSMGETDMAGGKSRWNYMQETVIGFAREICEIDSDGIGLVFFGGSLTVHDNCNVDKVKEAFASSRPSGSTPTAQALSEAIKLAKKSDKKAFTVCFTDGTPDNKNELIDVIKRQANSQTRDEDFTVLFVQVGRDPGASEFLRKLDDDIPGAKFDIVDAKTIEEVEKYSSIPELILAAISD